MRRMLIGCVIVGVLFNTGLTLAQDQDAGSIPAKVQAFLDNLTGTWNCTGTFEGTVESQWDSHKKAVITNGQWTSVKEGTFNSWTEIWHWDGTSDDGVQSTWLSVTNHKIAQGEIRGKVLSDTAMVGDEKVVGDLDVSSTRVHMEYQGPDKYTLSVTNVRSEGEERPNMKIVFTQANPASDEEELIKLEHELAEAFVKRDIQTIDRINGDDMTFGTSEGTFVSEEDVMNYVRSEKFDTVSVVCEGLKPKVYGDMAVVTGTIKVTNKKGRTQPQLITDVFLRRNGAWQMVATHSSNVPGEQSVDESKLSPEMKKLEVFVGDWAYEGEQMEPPVEGLPFGGAGKFSGTATTRFVLDGAFQENRFQDTEPVPVKGVGLTGYDAKKKCYVRYGFVDDGSQSISTTTLDGHILKIDSVTTTSKGDKVPVRVVNKYASDWSSYVATVEASPDKGKTWKLWWKERGKKVKD